MIRLYCTASRSRNNTLCPISTLVVFSAAAAAACCGHALPLQVTFPSTLDMYEFCAPSLQAILKVKINHITMKPRGQTSGSHACCDRFSVSFFGLLAILTLTIGTQL